MNKQSILIVDDDNIIREKLKKELERSFFNIVTAKNGKEATLKFNREIDIAILDINLPDIDGITLLSEFKETNPDCQVIIITGFGTHKIAIQAIRQGAIDYLEKPFKIDMLEIAIGRAIEKLKEIKKLKYKSSILLIDDEKEFIERLAISLKKENFEIFTAFNGEEALNRLLEKKIDVIVTDINMPKVTGIEVLKKAKEYFSDIEVIMITGRGDHNIAISALKAGASDYLVKPVDLNELIISINRAIEQINFKRQRLFRHRELKISNEIVGKMNEELERLISQRTKKLDQTQAQLFQTSKLATLGEMAAGLAHEMNQPLGGISLICQTFEKLKIRNLLTDDELNSGIKDIKKSVTRMSKIINHIRTFSRQDSHSFTKISVNEVIENALSLLGEQLRIREVLVEKDFSDIPDVFGEPYQVEQVIINVITNARDALELKSKDKKIILRTQKCMDTAFLSITDNGTGMSQKEIEKIFEPFFTTKEVGKGTGLGMSISYGIIESHGGKIEVESEKGKGTTIKIYLPFYKPDSS